MSSYAEIKKKVPNLLQKLTEAFGVTNALSMLRGVNLDLCHDGHANIEASKMLIYSFSWEKTSQGYVYWRDIVRQLRALQLND